METLKYYEDQLDEIKGDLIKEIKELIPNGCERELSNQVQSYGYTSEFDYDTLVISDVLVNGDLIMFRNLSIDCEEIADSDIMLFDERTILCVLGILRSDIRKEKLDELRSFLKQRGDDFEFDGSFGFHAVVEQSPDDECVNHEKSMIRRIKLDASGGMYFCCEYEGELVSEGEGHLPFNELDDIMDYIKSQVC